MTRKYEQAARLAEQALGLKDEPATRLLLARTLLALERYGDALEVARRLLDDERQSRQASKIVAASYAGLKDWREALIYLERLRAEATEASVLNLAAECHLNLNEPEKAVPLLRRSLEVDPDQPDIKTLLETAEKRIKK